VAKVSVTDKDNGYRELVKRVIGMKKPVSIATGILAAKGAEFSPKSKLSVLEYGVVNEFGSSDGRVPERSFIRAWFDENEPKLRELLVVLMRQAIKGDLTRQQVLDQVGQYAVGSIQQRIADGIGPENAPSTVAKKHSTKPLIDTGTLRSAISYEIRERGLGGGE
jgi:hypothetical protein